MRSVSEFQPELGSVPIESIDIDARSRDDIPAILLGLQLIWCDPKARQELFALLELHGRPRPRAGAARPGMDMWRILVLATLRYGLGCDLDRLQELANQHRTVRMMLGHGDDGSDGFRYSRWSVRTNMAAVSPELLHEVNLLVVSTGHAVARKRAWLKIGRAG